MSYKADSVLKNQIFNVSIQILNILILLVSIPYITRLFGPTILGKINFAGSIVQYFFLIATVGIPIYATREIARYRDDINLLRKKFKEITILQIIFTLIATLLYLVIVFMCDDFRKDIYIYLFLGIQIISNSFDFSWFIQGLEKYRYTAITNFISKLINLILIFTLLKSRGDYNIYTFITGITFVINNLINLVIVTYLLKDFKNIKKINIEFKSLKLHVYSLSIFFISDIATNIYTIMDQTMIGALDSSAAVSYYSMSVKLINIILRVITSIIVVMIPRISNSINKNTVTEIKKYINISIKGVYLLSIPSIFGILAIGEEIVILFLGEEYIKSILAFKAISILLIIKSLSEILSMQVMIPYGREKKFTLMLIVASFINFVLNLILIPKCSYVGATISTLITEVFITSWLYLEAKSIVGTLDAIFKIWKMLIPSIIFYLIIKVAIKPFIDSNILIVTFSILIAIMIYVIGLIVLKDDFILYIIKKISKKIE